jgi:F-type H+-transporting ATPase subunit b
MLEFNYTILIQFLNFLILLILLNFLLFKPVLNALRKRKASIQSLSERVSQTQDEAENLARGYEEGMKDGKRPIFDQRETALREANAASMKVIEKARQELTEELTKVKETVRSEAELTLQALQLEADKLSLEVAQKILKR